MRSGRVWPILLVVFSTTLKLGVHTLVLRHRRLAYLVSGGAANCDDEYAVELSVAEEYIREISGWLGKIDSALAVFFLIALVTLFMSRNIHIVIRVLVASGTVTLLFTYFPTQ